MSSIDFYEFGLIVVDGKEYSSDIIIFPDKIRSDWWRKRGHELCLEDITDVLEQKPEVLVVGTGASGLMKVLPEVKKAAQARGIKLIAEPTDKARNTYNELSRSQRVVAAFHLTC
ncbi:MAG: hypothetical protein FJ025_02310 [Chloroflexi bacterium]|nr:hypothetical protein [Chloroflexota bacterium]